MLCRHACTTTLVLLLGLALALLPAVLGIDNAIKEIQDCFQKEKNDCETKPTLCFAKCLGEDGSQQQDYLICAKKCPQPENTDDEAGYRANTECTTVCMNKVYPGLADSVFVNPLLSNYSSPVSILIHPRDVENAAPSAYGASSSVLAAALGVTTIMARLG
ncbi:hypothetical protein H4R34_002982 [Dimargaris verticillata]|uniref:Uncharacterized protein n=1 Tax=Dimargaris verticillata TaxID=2761393 RepID=A0A9W8B1Q6_9FUNG|nr:hypothetical protein H4R34_002982 [Dimargaris verticillata]